MIMVHLNKYEILINDLLFGYKTKYSIEVMDYIKDIYKCDDFVADTKIIIKRGKVQIVTEKIIVDDNTVMWKLTLKR